jgi:hypothetical protein
MTQRKFPRIEIDQRAYDALQAEGILRHKTVREIATEAILASISKEAIELTDRKTSESLASHFKDIATFGSDQNSTEKECLMVGDVIICSPKKKRLADNPDALAAIKEMWTRTPRPSLATMARELGYTKVTVADNVRKMQERGDLV